MKLKMLVSIAGVDFALDPGAETERFSGDEAVRLIEAGIAVPVAEQEVEKATRKPREKRA
ncbi:hypothetical protein [Flavobacterium sp.]|jgi:hypothetical protein|uniref:hypothetical protein n=1 Tax=Flavobacterium sp. TaxID=239 RepID=UPI0037C07DDB